MTSEHTLSEPVQSGRKKLFENIYRTTFAEVDAAGIMFFPRHFELAQRTIELWTHQAGLYQLWFVNPEVIVPVRNAQADYVSPVNQGAEVKCTLYLAELKSRSLKFETVLAAAESSEDISAPDSSAPTERFATITTVHLFVNPKNLQRIEIPSAITSAITSAIHTA